VVEAAITPLPDLLILDLSPATFANPWHVLCTLRSRLGAAERSILLRALPEHPRARLDTPTWELRLSAITVSAGGEGIKQMLGRR
jgi:hypothetical protein